MIITMPQIKRATSNDLDAMMLRAMGIEEKRIGFNQDFKHVLLDGKEYRLNADNIAAQHGYAVAQEKPWRWVAESGTRRMYGRTKREAVLRLALVIMSGVR
jgi:hypothetical protein